MSRIRSQRRGNRMAGEEVTPVAQVTVNACKSCVVVELVTPSLMDTAELEALGVLGS